MNNRTLIFADFFGFSNIRYNLISALTRFSEASLRP